MSRLCTPVLAVLCAAATASPSRPLRAAQTQEPEPIPAGRAPAPDTYSNGMDVLHYDLEVALDSGSARFSGRARIEVRLLAPPPEALVFDLSGLAVYAVSLDGAGAQFAQDRGRLRIPLPDGHVAGDEVQVSIDYGGVPDDGLHLGRNVHGEPSAFADNWPNRARFWFPSVDFPGDKATVAFTVHAPEPWTVVANGRLVGEPEPARPGALGGHQGKRTWRWRSDVDIPTYTMVVGAADFSVHDVGLAACGRAPASPRDDGCVEVSYWVFPQDTAAAAAVFARAAQMTEFFSGTVGPFPYEKMANVESATRFGGMENASAIFYSEENLSAGETSEGTVSHEIAHQWFGDSVTESDWHHLWLSEGLATYFGHLFFEFADGSESLRERMEEDRARYLESGDEARPIIDPAEQDLFALLNRNNYQKAGWVLHMLRNQIGDDAFFQGIRAYYANHANGTALTADFRREMEAASGEDLAWFFDQWFRRPGHPVLRVEGSSGGEGSVVTVEQVQPSDWPTFRFPLTVELVQPTGETSRERFQVSARRQEFPAPGPAPASLRVDPEGVLLHELRR